jgi:lipopolysaccharide/colanic/teichoic acid biosynthesis glycosyltransferase
MEYGRRCRRVAAAKRIADIGIASVGIAVLVVLFIPICCAIRVSSSGPVIFRQTRVGVNRRSRQSAALHGARRSVDIGGRPFVMYKFRSMRNTRDATAMLSFPGDQRITGVGAVLRRTHIDELPQFWNVLKGDMSVIGPRPEQVDISVRYVRDVDRYAQRMWNVKPGITGLAQILQGYINTIDDVARTAQLDTAYGSSLRSLWSWLKMDVWVTAITMRYLVSRWRPVAPATAVPAPPLRSEHEQ